MWMETAKTTKEKMFVFSAPIAMPKLQHTNQKIKEMGGPCAWEDTAPEKVFKLNLLVAVG